MAGPTPWFFRNHICPLPLETTLHKLSDVFGQENVGIYRDDGLAILQNKSGPQLEHIRKELIQIFKLYNFQITTECNLNYTDFLDVTFNLKENSYKPFQKSNSTPVYINIHSNHPPSIKKEIPKIIGKRLLVNSCNNKVFSAAAPTYNTGLQKSSYNSKVTFTENRACLERKHSKNRRKRNILWFNPPFSDHVITNIGKVFFQLLDKHFTNNNRLHKIFNSVKLSYSCMPNLAPIISNHNKKILDHSFIHSFVFLFLITTRANIEVKTHQIQYHYSTKDQN